ncbi:hypothetical protein ABPG74_004190 [Tetrahymena malaccensis]
MKQQKNPLILLFQQEQLLGLENLKKQWTKKKKRANCINQSKLTSPYKRSSTKNTQLIQETKNSKKKNKYFLKNSNKPLQSQLFITTSLTQNPSNQVTKNNLQEQIYSGTKKTQYTAQEYLQSKQLFLSKISRLFLQNFNYKQISTNLTQTKMDTQTYDQSRPAIPPQHFDMVLNQVKNRNNYLDLGMETGQTFFQFYHQFNGNIVGIDLNSQRVEFVRQKAQKILPTQAINRTQLIDGDVFKIADKLPKTFDLVTIGSQIHNFGSPDKFYQFAKERLLSTEGTLALTSINPLDVEFQACYDDKENAALRKDFATLNEYLSEYAILPNNPFLNQGVMMRHFNNIQKFEQNVEQVMEAEHVFEYFRTLPSYIKYMQDDTQVDKYALQNFERKVREKIQKRSLTMTKQQSLLRVTHKILTFLLRK